MIILPSATPSFIYFRLSNEECSDDNLLFAVIFTRYCPQLLKFPFEGNREIKKETLEYAQKINARHPISSVRSGNNEFIIPKKSDVLLKDNSRERQSVTLPEIEEFLMNFYNSNYTRHLFLSLFDEEVYDFAKQYYAAHNFYPMRFCNPIIAVVRCMQIVKANEEKYHQFGKDLFDVQTKRTDTGPGLLGLPSVRNHLTARFDVTIEEEGGVIFDVLQISDRQAYCIFPGWMEKKGIKGIVLQSCRGEVDFTLKMYTSGTLNIALRSMDIRGEDGCKIPHWIEYISFRVNGEEKLQEKKPVWHDKPVKFIQKVSADEQIHFHAVWTPYSEK